MSDQRVYLHKEARGLIDLVAAAGRPPLHKLSVKVARKATLALTRIDGTNPRFDGEISDLNIPVEHYKGGIDVTVYRPSGFHRNPAIWVYFHGGGFVVGDRTTVDSACKIISSKARCIVVNVEYRLGPEFKSPASIDDGIAVTKWIIQNKTEIGGGDISIVGVGGDSAGGGISANICHEVPVDFQILIYPVVDLTKMYPSHSEYMEGYLLEMETAVWFHRHAFVNNKDMVTISTLRRDESSFRRQPPCLIIISECDVLRDPALAYAEKLKRAGRHVETVFLNGMIHGFYTFPGLFPETCEHAYQRTADFIKARTHKSSTLSGKL